MTTYRNDHFIKSFGERVQSLRKEKGLTVGDLADLCVVHDRQIGRIERGEVNTSISMVFRVAEAFEMTVGDLMGFEY